MIRRDKFKIGDMIEFDPVFVERTLADAITRNGKGPFKIKNIREIHGRSLKTVGHTQHVVIDTEEGYDRSFSGAFFKPLRKAS